MQKSDIHYWLAALRLEGIGPIRLRRWIETFGDLKNLFSATFAELQAAGLSRPFCYAIKNPNWSLIEKDLMWCEKNNCHCISYLDQHYPKLLKEIADAPVLLFVRGEIDCLSAPQLAIVGSRNPSTTGRELAEQFAYCLAGRGFAITSGLALGIDAASHHGALMAKGKTLAVCGTGLQHIYPSSHAKLAEKIIANGALISEFPLNFPPKAKHFPMRNRIISGLSLGVLVVEAALKSGSLITARLANEQGREVFALPGSIHNPLARGCHELIRQGAKLVETAEDILDEVGAMQKIFPASPALSAKLNRIGEQVFAQIGYEITTLDAIILRSGLTPAEVCSMLLELELGNFIKLVPGGYIRHP